MERHQSDGHLALGPQIGRQQAFGLPFPEGASRIEVPAGEALDACRGLWIDRHIYPRLRAVREMRDLERMDPAGAAGAHDAEAVERQGFDLWPFRRRSRFQRPTRAAG